jgi:sulfatase modifying factor 1
MGSDPRGGIARSGASGSYTYEVRANMGEKPVNYVSWYDAVRFCNWLHNGQPGGAQDSTTTEDGAYTLTGPSSIRAGTDPDHGVDGRNAGAKYHLPGDDEWYKAAYHQPASQGGDADDYWLYPTASNSAPTIATADATGNVNNDTENIANYERGADWDDQDGNLTTVGSGGPGSASYYGAFDMGGNASEWYELMTLPFLGYRGQRGGSALHLTGPSSLQSLNRIFEDPTWDRSNSTGFRVAGVPAVLEAPFAITEIDLSADKNTVTLTWTSTPGQSYTVKVSTDLTNWDTGLDASVEASEGDTTSEVFSIGGRVSDDGGIFFRVEIK